MNQFSLCPVFIRAVSVPNKVETVATGFGFSSDGNERADYLITNWHVVAGTHAEAPQVECYDADYLEVYTHYLPDRGLGSLAGGKESIRQVGVLDKRDGSPLWLEHQLHQDSDQVIDIACLRMPRSEEWQIKIEGEEDDQRLGETTKPDALLAANGITEQFEYGMGVGDQVFVVGFPFGERTQTTPVPIWKGGTIASEPQFDIATQSMDEFGKSRDEILEDENRDPSRCFYIDSSTTSGMSGSPVVRREREPNGDVNLEWIGVYASRHPRSGSGPTVGGCSQDWSDLQLGVVWGAEVVKEIVEDGCSPSSSAHPARR